MRHIKDPNLPDLNVTGAWALGYTGRGRVVTFLDDGLEFDHPDLVDNYVNFLNQLHMAVNDLSTVLGQRSQHRYQRQ